MDYRPLPWPFPWMGLVTEREADHIPPEGLVTATNVIYAKPDWLRSRGEIADDHTCATDDIIKMYWWDYDSKLYAADDNAKLYKGGAAVAGPAQNVTDMCSFGPTGTPVLIVCENETANPSLHQYTGSAYSAVSGTDVPKIRLAMVRFERLWGTKSADFPSRVFFSKKGDHTVWSGDWGDAGHIDIAPGEDGDILDWIEYRGTLYIFKERGIYTLTGSKPFAYEWQKLTDADELVVSTIANCGRSVLYATGHGVFPLGAPFEAETYDLTRNVETDILPSLVSGSMAAYSPEMAGYVVVDGTATAWVSNHNNRPDVWTKLTLPQAAKSVYEGAGLWFGGTNGHVYKYDHSGYEDDSSPFTVQIKSGNWHAGDNQRRKDFRIAQGDINAGENATATLKLYVDGGGSATLTQAFTANSRNLVVDNFDFQELAYEVSYTAMTGPVLFGGIQLQLEPPLEHSK